MEHMLDLIVERPIAACAGLFGMLCLAAYPLARGRSLLLTAYLGNTLGFAAHYALLGQPTAVTMNLMLAVQTLVALGFGRWPRLRWTYYALIPILLAAAAMTWQGRVSLLSTSATMLSTFGRIQANEFALRALMLVSAPVWAAHDLWVGSLPGLIADLSCIVTGGWMLISMHRVSCLQWRNSLHELCRACAQMGFSITKKRSSMSNGRTASTSRVS